jgi:hypothetical protein
MMFSRRRTLALLASLISVPFAAGAQQPRVVVTVPSDRLITAKRMGLVVLGMTLEEARNSARGASFARTSDGDGVALVQITFAPDVSMQVWAEEEDPEKPIDWRRRIRVIETFSPAFRTDDGVHPGSAISELNRLYGKTKSIETSEIESRKFITFTAHPVGLTFRVDETGQRLWSIAISADSDR